MLMPQASSKPASPPGPGASASAALEVTELVGGDVAVSGWMGDCLLGCGAAGLVCLVGGLVGSLGVGARLRLGQHSRLCHDGLTRALPSVFKGL